MEKFNPDNLFFTSDTHFYHNNIIKYCDRPFDSIEQMNNSLIENWNSVIAEDSIVFHLGDFCMGGKDWCPILEKLNGIKYLVTGNHDKVKDEYLSYFKGVYEGFHMIEVGKKKLVLTHFPLLVFHGFGKEQIWNIHGHIHSTKKKCDLSEMPGFKSYLTTALPNQYDVGVDFNDYTPISYRSLESKVITQIEANSNLSMFMK